MTRTPFLIATILLAVSSSPLLARGGQFGPIGPGSRDGLQPSIHDTRSDAFANAPQRPVVKMRSHRARQTRP